MQTKKRTKTIATTTQLTDLLTLTHTIEEERETFTVQLSQAAKGLNPFETYEDNSGEQISAEFYLKRETALKLALEIFRSVGLEFSLEIEGKLEALPKISQTAILSNNGLYPHSEVL